MRCARSEASASGQVVTFLTERLGFPIPWPALLEKIGNRFRREATAFATQYEVPILALKKPDRVDVPHVTQPAPVGTPNGCGCRSRSRPRNQPSFGKTL